MDSRFCILGLLINRARQYCPHVRIDKVLTNLPLQPDKPITFGVTEYCTECGICAVECPSGAISPDKKRSFKPPPSAGRCGNPGALKWYIDGKRCSRWWAESGAPCSNCMNVCPYTQATLGDGPVSPPCPPVSPPLSPLILPKNRPNNRSGSGYVAFLAPKTAVKIQVQNRNISL